MYFLSFLCCFEAAVLISFNIGQCDCESLYAIIKNIKACCSSCLRSRTSHKTEVLKRLLLCIFSVIIQPSRFHMCSSWIYSFYQTTLNRRVWEYKQKEQFTILIVNQRIGPCNVASCVTFSKPSYCSRYKDSRFYEFHTNYYLNSVLHKIL